ncbi:MAG: 3-deoxy-8-phosphooctulonate synthase [Chitinispirillaceae bacterium]
MNDSIPKAPFLKYTDIARPGPFFIAGPCVIESEDLCCRVAEELVKLAESNNVDIIFKSSFYKANRTSLNSYRGPGKQEGLKILDNIRQQFDIPVLTDIHESQDAQEIAQAVDILQIPAFLCRQTDLLESAKATGKWINIKKGQFMAPEDMKYSLQKAGGKCWLTERGTFFGYNRLVVDFISIPTMKKYGRAVVFDATHSVQQPGGGNGCSSGNREMALPLARAALASGADALFMEIHPDPDKAFCDGPNSLSVQDFTQALPKLIDIYNVVNG